jgi:hypothetical protein
MNCVWLLGIVAAIGLAACETSHRSNGPTGAAGTGAAGAGPVSVAACGGDLEGEWEGFDPRVPDTGDPFPEEPCHKLNLSLQNDGTYVAWAWWPIPDRREARLRFQGGQFSWGLTLRGPVAQTFGASCLAAVAPPPTCAQLGAALQLSGLSEGTTFDVACTSAAGGGCACTATVVATSGPAGMWSVTGGRLRVVTYLGAMPDKTVEGPYCIQNGTLRLDGAFEAAAKGISRITFGPLTASP